MITATIIILLVAIIIILLAILTGSVVALSPLLLDILAFALVIRLAFPKRKVKKEKEVVIEQPEYTIKFCPKCGENLMKLKAIKVANRCPYCGQKMQ